jgi:hypothetical protein
MEMVQLKKGNEMLEVTKKTHNDLKALEEIIQSNDNLQLAAFLENLLPVELARVFWRRNPQLES